MPLSPRRPMFTHALKCAVSPRARNDVTYFLAPSLKSACGAAGDECCETGSARSNAAGTLQLICRVICRIEVENHRFANALASVPYVAIVVRAPDVADAC